MSAYGLGIARSGPYGGSMNENHTQLCPSPEWATHIHEDVLPWLTRIATLGDNMLELGPGPGAATEWLRSRVKRLVALEFDDVAAKLLAERFADTNVVVVRGDATNMDFATGTFDSVGSFTMLHHLPTFDAQQRLLNESLRVLRPGGVFLGSDSLASNGLHHFHEGDDYNPVEPASFLTRLQVVGFTNVTINVDGNIKFVAHKPDSSIDDRCSNEEKE